MAMKRAKCKITVLKRTFHEDLAGQYAVDGKSMGPCELLRDNQEFIFDGYNYPEGFCSWAWADIQRDASLLSNADANPSWINRKGTTITCCTDGVRPVIFRIERIE
jgi:uncharacterized repeat protein (TIGR04076 family)